MRKTRLFALVLLLLSIQHSEFNIHHSAHAQLPGWLTVHDRDGTVFFLDSAMKLHPAEDPAKGYRTVEKGSFVFLFSEADELMRLRRAGDALRIWKSVRYLSSLDPSISVSGAQATAKIRALAVREKDRFDALDLDTALLLVRRGTLMHARHEAAGYTLVSGGTISVVKRRLTGANGYMLDAAAFGVSDDPNADGFDAIVTVSAESFRNSFEFIDSYEATVRNKTPDDSYRREKLSSDTHSVLYRYEGGAPAVYAGYEKLCAYGHRGFVVRAFAPKDSAKGQETAKKLITSFEIGYAAD